MNFEEVHVMNLHFNFTYGVVTRHFAGIKFIHNARFYKMMVLNLLRVTKNDNMILLQNPPTPAGCWGSAPEKTAPETERQRDRQTERQTARQTDRQLDR